MMDNKEVKERKDIRFLDYIYVLYKWKKFIIINMILILLITAGLSLLIDNKYKAKATVMLPQNSQLGGSALSGVLSGASSILGGSLFGANDNSDRMLGILSSRTVLTKVIKRFNLLEYYGFSKYKNDRTLKALRGDVSFDMDENGMIEITMIHKDSVKSAQIVNYFVNLLDSLNRKFSLKEATDYRIFVEKRYKKNLEDLKNAEDMFEKFQAKNGVYVIPDQLEFAIKAVGDLEVQLTQKQIESDLVKATKGKNSPTYKDLQIQISLLNNKLNGLKYGDKSVERSIIFFPFIKAPEIQKRYFRLYREIEIQGKIQEFIMPIYEQAVMEEHKNMPTIVVLDKAVPPELKYSPKRSFIVIGIGLFFFFTIVLFVFRGEEAINWKNFNNPLEEKEKRFFERILKFYRLKF
ncbi:tyrosine-protein kinase ptk [bacterium BMS3Abin04]|nr:tyrosine-protein kinase ptk [bacterium BMS3Abin04]